MQYNKASKLKGLALAVAALVSVPVVAMAGDSGGPLSKRLSQERIRKTGKRLSPRIRASHPKLRAGKRMNKTDVRAIKPGLRLNKAGIRMNIHKTRQPGTRLNPGSQLKPGIRMKPSPHKLSE